MYSRLDQRGVVGKEHGKQLRSKHSNQPYSGGVAQAHNQQQLVATAYALFVAGAKIIADNRLRTLREALQWHQRKVHHAGQNGHGANGDITAVTQQGRIEANGKQTLGGLHHKRRKTQRHAGQINRWLNPQILSADFERCFFARQESEHPTGRNRLRKNRRQCSALYVLIECFMELNDGGSLEKHNCCFFVNAELGMLHDFSSKMDELKKPELGVAISLLDKDKWL